MLIEAGCYCLEKSFENSYELLDSMISSDPSSILKVPALLFLTNH